MPSKAPPIGPHIKEALKKLGQKLKEHRKKLKVTTIAAANAAGLSRTTLSRIEKGEESVAMGSYMCVIQALGLNINLVGTHEEAHQKTKLNKGSIIKISDYPELKKISWQLSDTTELSAKEAFDIYRRNWRHVDLNQLQEFEKQLIKQLQLLFGKEGQLV